MSEYDTIIKRLEHHKEVALKNDKDNHDWFVIALQGSQNYGIATPESDVDSKMLMLPTIEELVFNKKPINRVQLMENDEHCDMKDVREYFKIFRKQNINFVEILFTDYWIVNPKYADLWDALLSKREELVRMNEYAAVSCMAGMAKEKYKAMTHIAPHSKEVIEKYGFEGKSLSHLIRISNFIVKYINQEPYKECLIPYDPEGLIKIKRNTIDLPLSEIQTIASLALGQVTLWADKFKETHKNEFNPAMDKYLNDILHELITRRLKEEVNN